MTVGVFGGDHVVIDMPPASFKLIMLSSNKGEEPEMDKPEHEQEFEG